MLSILAIGRDVCRFFLLFAFHVFYFQVHKPTNYTMKKLLSPKWSVAMLIVAAMSCQPPPACPDLVVNSVISYGSSGNVMPYGVAIKNIGTAVANINSTNNRVYWQAWLSMDGVTRSVAACGSSFDQPLGVNQITWVRIDCTFPANLDFRSYRSLIVDLYAGETNTLGECNTSNNSFVRTPLPL